MDINDIRRAAATNPNLNLSGGKRQNTDIENDINNSGEKVQRLDIRGRGRGFGRGVTGSDEFMSRKVQKEANQNEDLKKLDDEAKKVLETPDGGSQSSGAEGEGDDTDMKDFKTPYDPDDDGPGGSGAGGQGGIGQGLVA